MVTWNRLGLFFLGGGILEGAQKTLFFHMVSGLGLQFSYEKLGFKTMVFYKENYL